MGPRSLQSVWFDNDSSLVVSSTPTSHRNVTTTRGTFATLPLHLPADICTPIREAVDDYATNVCRVASPQVVADPPKKVRARPQPEVMSIRRSERLEKKSHLRATKPALQAQNLLMRRLGLTTETAPPDATSFQHFVDTFSSTLSKSQCEALDVLLPNVSSFVTEVDPETLLA